MYGIWKTGTCLDVKTNKVYLSEFVPYFYRIQRKFKDSFRKLFLEVNMSSKKNLISEKVSSFLNKYKQKSL